MTCLLFSFLVLPGMQVLILVFPPISQLATIMEIILWDVLMFYQIFLSPQVKRRAITSNKQSVYELHYELPNDLRLLRKIKRISKLARIIN